ncbi:type 1 fimbrial protein [Pseudomonas putida]|uniref:type 1 fimbrial protein n=1 Tax=Pseudomonas putida TaxID=303 RepID=UPI002365B40A|nr:type 1 fimbrial protein [Pseudomonas putida]MDD2049989.1 type 1 fimbrial protein [Pseudomonas putida]
MNGKLQIASAAILFSLGAVSQAAPPVAQGEIRFTGSIVESSCSTSFESSGWRMEGCPTLARGTGIHLRQIKPQASLSALDNTAVQVKLVADSGDQGRYYDQQYALVDKLGRPVTSGQYLITLTTP